MNGDPILKVRLAARYGSRSVLQGIHFDLHAGQALGLIGSSGAGKTTLVLALLGLLSWRGGIVSGEVLLDGVNLLQMKERDARRVRGKKLALIPQSPMTALNTAVSLRSHFAEAWSAHATTGKKALEARLESLLPEVQLPHDVEFLSRRPSQISVGQAQRVCIALALLHSPAVVIADEPTSALDPITQSEIVRLLLRLNRRMGMTLLYISHDLISVLQLCDRLAVLSEGTIAESLPVAALGQARHPSTLALLEALPVPYEVLLRGKKSSIDSVTLTEELETQYS